MHALVACDEGVEAMTNVIVGLNQDEREHEVEITPEMMEAGASELRGYDSLEDYPRDWVSSIYLAMEAARREVPCGPRRDTP